jgi:hypothetical protein
VPCVSLGFPSPKVFKIGCSFVVPLALNPSGPSGPPDPVVPRPRWSHWWLGCLGVPNVLMYPSPKVFKIGCSFVVPPALNPSGPSGPPASVVPRPRWSHWWLGCLAHWWLGCLGVPNVLMYPSPKVFKIGCSFVVPPALNPSGPSGPPASVVFRPRWSHWWLGCLGVHNVLMFPSPLVPLVAGVPWGAQCPNGGWGVLEVPSFVVQAADFVAFHRLRVLS